MGFLNLGDGSECGAPVYSSHSFQGCYSGLLIFVSLNFLRPKGKCIFMRLNKKKDYVQLSLDGDTDVIYKKNKAECFCLK